MPKLESIIELRIDTLPNGEYGWNAGFSARPGDCLDNELGLASYRDCIARAAPIRSVAGSKRSSSGHCRTSSLGLGGVASGSGSLTSAAASLVLGLALVLRYLAGGRYELGETLPLDAGDIANTAAALAMRIHSAWG